jgi:8-oxo-dGTP diphosphatase
VRSERGEVLLVNPTYKPGWDIPGGMAEANEPPHVAAERELREELGLALSVGRLLVVEWVAPHGPWDDTLVFVFDGGILNTNQAAELTLGDGELREARFWPHQTTGSLLRDHVQHRLNHALEVVTGNGHTRYSLANA